MPTAALPFPFPAPNLVAVWEELRSRQGFTLPFTVVVKAGPDVVVRGTYRGPAGGTYDVYDPLMGGGESPITVTVTDAADRARVIPLDAAGEPVGGGILTQ